MQTDKGNLSPIFKMHTNLAQGSASYPGTPLFLKRSVAIEIPNAEGC